jgi:hypothetical protein
VAYFKTLSQNFREATDKDTQKKIAAWVSGMRFEPGTFEARSRNANISVVTDCVFILQFGYQDHRKALTVYDYDDGQDTRQVCPCHKYGLKKRCVGVNMHLITVHFGPCEEDGISV